MISLSKAAGGIVQSEIRVMSVECEKADGVNLAQGVCDTETPEPVRRGAHDAIEAGVNAYTRLDGLADVRKAIAAKMQGFNGIEADPEREVIVTVGSTGAFYCACLALLDPGDEVIIFEPFYGYHVNTLDAVKAKPVFVRLNPPDWKFSREILERAINPKTKAIVVNSPANPSGKVFTREELNWICELAARHDLFIFTDEIYEYFVYDGREHVSMGALPNMAERTITISGVSKTFSVTGWRIGYLICSARWAGAIGYFHDLIYICAPAPLQKGVGAGLNKLDESFYKELRADYARKRDQICAALTSAGLEPCVPQGAYYVLANASSLPGRNSKEKAMNLLAATGVASVPGEAFFHDDAGKNLLRFCFAKSDGDLKDACRRLEKVQASALTESRAR